jgi:cell division protein FtsI (penicillin-binding protein 3)
VETATRRRAGFLIALFGVAFSAVLVRLFSIQVSAHETFNSRREAQTRGLVKIEPARGEILDIRGQVLAVSVPVESVWANPSEITDRPEAARVLAGALGLKEDLVRERLEAPKREFVWIKRRVTPREAEAVRRLTIDPLFRPAKKSPETRLGLVTEYSRRYPFGTLLGNVLGFQSGDPSMHEGIERSMDSVLAGETVSAAVTVDGCRRPVGPSPSGIPGADVILTFDVLFQKVVEEELDAACAEFRPKWAVAIAMDPRTGEIRAIANRPGFDPSEPAKAEGEARLNRAVAVPYEPGSTLKPFLAAMAIDQGLATPQTKFDCENGLWKHGSRILHDHHPYGTLTLLDVITVSSNIGAAKLGALTLGKERLHAGLRSFGFGARTGIDLPAEDDGRLFPLARWNSFSVTSVPIGHEIAVTPLQLVTAMSALVNGGTLYRPFAIRRVQAPDGTVLAENGPRAVRRVVGEKAAREMVEILKNVVEKGTGKKAQVPGTAVGGKTGTTQKVDPKTRQYTHERFISSFVGFAPAEKPRVCVAVVMDEPQGAYYGGATAAPVVGKIVQRGLIYLD